MNENDSGSCGIIIQLFNHKSVKASPVPRSFSALVDPILPNSSFIPVTPGGCTLGGAPSVEPVAASDMFIVASFRSVSASRSNAPMSPTPRSITERNANNFKMNMNNHTGESHQSETIPGAWRLPSSKSILRFLF